MRGIDEPSPIISIHTVSGEVVLKNLSTLYFGTGYEAIWDGKNANGKEVADGIYLVNVRIGDKSQILKIARISK
jgi:hypothetical protein